ncbi:uncharacterized protein PpBr36_11069 [Pyricularia pennisetigena]|uniref:uncharacterized protein n=1 Tax=Pyricularia pennisetigena TaxID=1578925 RepID=UPI001154A542|nr:uncharacterized protein PpBr36_11069 [Pyricularia pennisetigena]TLS20632.1 hypothetical protein PpBr36_11069 [Pyricularia pennisetigena]
MTSFTVSTMTEHMPCMSLGDPHSCMDPFPNKVRDVAVPVLRLGWNFSLVNELVATDEVTPDMEQILLEYADIRVTNSGVSIMCEILDPLECTPKNMLDPGRMPDMITLDTTGSSVHIVTRTFLLCHLHTGMSFLSVPSTTGLQPMPTLNEDTIDSVKQCNNKTTAEQVYELSVMMSDMSSGETAYEFLEMYKAVLAEMLTIKAISEKCKHYASKSNEVRHDAGRVHGRIHELRDGGRHEGVRG